MEQKSTFCKCQNSLFFWQQKTKVFCTKYHVETEKPALDFYCSRIFSHTIMQFDHHVSFLSSLWIYILVFYLEHLELLMPLLQLGSQEGNLEFSIIKGVLRAAGKLAKLYTQNNSYTRAFTRFPIWLLMFGLLRALCNA